MQISSSHITSHCVSVSTHSTIYVLNMGSSQSSNKIPKDLKNASVHVALQNTCYLEGETVAGYVDITIVNGSVQCQQIDIEMKCETKTTVHYTTHSGSGKNRRTHHHTARQSDQNYRLRMTGIQFPYGRADIGHYQVPFEFIVPHEAPSTVLVPLVGRNSAAVTHMIAVGINVGGGKVHYVHSVPFQVISKVNHPISETMIEDKKDIDCCCCFGKGEMILGAHLNKNAYSAGEQASITYEVNNASSSKVEKIQVELVASVRASANRHSFVRRNVLATMTCAAIEPHDGFGSHHPEGGPAKQFLLQIPSLCPYPSISVSTLYIEYNIVLTASTAFCVTNPTIGLTVTLYQQKLQQNAMVQGYNPHAEEIDNPADYDDLPPMYASVAYVPDSHALYTPPPAYMRTPVAIPVDTTGDGVANAVGYDTSGDGKIDALDTTGDGRIDMTMPSSNQAPPPPMANAVVQSPIQGLPVDTTGDGVANAIGYDTTGDGKIDALDTTGDGKIDMSMATNSNTRQAAPSPTYSGSMQSSVHPELQTTGPNAGYGSAYANSYGGNNSANTGQYSNTTDPNGYSSYSTSHNSVAPNSESMKR